MYFSSFFIPFSLYTVFIRRQQVLFGILLLLVTLSLGWQLGMQAERKHGMRQQEELVARFAEAGSGVTFDTDPEKEVDLSLLWTAWRILDQYYVDPKALSIDTLRYGAVSGLVGAIGDPYTLFMTPQENTDFQQVLRGTLEGIGAELTQRDGNVLVVAPIKGSPAARAGLLPLDIIVAVDGVSIASMNLEEVVQRIRGEKGTTVVLSIERSESEAEFEISIVRDRIHVPSVDSEVIETGTGSIGYVAINQFGESTVREATTAVRDVSAGDIKGLILDLRFNGGGFLEGAVDITSLFVKRGKVVSVVRRGAETESQYVSGSPLLPDLPMVVLINEGSASASEIVAGALQDYARAKIIGTRSFGKGTVQEVVDLPGGSSMRVTVAKWQTPNGREIAAHGIDPDITVPMEPRDLFQKENDIQKQAALEWLLDGEVWEEGVVEEEVVQ